MSQVKRDIKPSELKFILNTKANTIYCNNQFENEKQFDSYAKSKVFKALANNGGKAVIEVSNPLDYIASQTEALSKKEAELAAREAALLAAEESVKAPKVKKEKAEKEGE